VTYEQLIDGVREFTGLGSRPEAEKLLKATSKALSSCLTAPDRARWASHLPSELRKTLAAGAQSPTRSALDVYAAVAHAEGVGARFGTEHAQAAIRVLASVLDAESAELLAQHLPDELGNLMVDPTRSVGVALGPHRRPSSTARPGGSLATGAPGSSHPLSEAAPRSPQGSVGDWDEARMDHSLGSAEEPEEEDSLARGRPGSHRGLGDAKR